MALVWQEKGQLHCFGVGFLITHAHSFGIDTPSMTTAKENAEQCRQL